MPSKFRFPFYGSIHWYTLRKYYKELKKIGIKPHHEHDLNEKIETENEQKGARWLKEVSVERMSVSSRGSSISVSPVHSVEGIASPILSATSTLSQQHTSPASISSQSCQSTPISSLDSASHSYISSIEIDGLLTLLKKVQEEDLFLTESPPDFADPRSLASLLVSQLKSSKIKAILPTKPTGVSLLQQKSQKGLKLENRKRKRQSLRVSIPGKYSRIEKNSIESAVDSATKSQDTCTMLKVEKSELPSYPSEHTCVSGENHEEMHIKDGCSVVDIQSDSQSSERSPHNPLMNLASPIQSSELGDLSPDESVAYSPPASPCSPLTLCLPCTPTSPSATPLTPSHFVLPSTPTPLTSSS